MKNLKVTLVQRIEYTYVVSAESEAAAAKERAYEKFLDGLYLVKQDSEIDDIRVEVLEED